MRMSCPAAGFQASADMFRTLGVGLVVTIVCAVPAPAHAQSPWRGDVAINYSFQRLFDNGDSYNLHTGWLVSVAARPGTSPVSLVGEVAGNYDRESGETLSLHTYQGGVRLTARSNRGIKPFAQFLLGGMTAACCGESATAFSIEPGGGVDLALNGRASLRLALSFPTAFSEGEVGKSARYQVGVAMPFGHK